MHRIWFFDFESRMWSTRLTTGGRNDWTFGHAVRRSRYMYAYGTHSTVHTEESLVAVRLVSWPCTAAAVFLILSKISCCPLHGPGLSRTIGCMIQDGILNICKAYAVRPT